MAADTQPAGTPVVPGGPHSGRGCFVSVAPYDACELALDSGGGLGWFVGGEGANNMCAQPPGDPPVVHLPLAECPAGDGKNLAEQLSALVDRVTLPASESDTTGRVVVIHPAADGIDIDGTSVHLPNGPAVLETEQGRTIIARVCMAGLGIGLWRRGDMDFDIEDAVFVRARDWQELPVFYADPDDPVDDVTENLQLATKLLSTLRDGFELNFSDQIVTAPVLYGGRAHDGSIVAVLSMRVWT